MTDLVTLVADAAERWPARTAWRFPSEQNLTFAEVSELSAGYAQALRGKGVTAGDRVAVMLPNRAEFPLLWLALARLGAALVPVNMKYRSADTEHLLTDSGAVLLITEDTLDDLKPEPGFDQQPIDPAAIVNVQYTSGTTGVPKGCLLSHRYWLALAGSLVDEFPHLTDSDVMLTAQPFSYVDPQWNVVAALLSGAELVVLDGFHPSTFWADVRRHRVTYFYCLGAMPNLLLAMPQDSQDQDHAVRVVQCSAIPPSRHADLEERWGVPWFEAFGMTETGADIRVGADEHDELVGTGCLGRPAAHREIRVDDAGELLLRGPGMFDGYLGHPAPWRDGWFPTGDLARLDEQGRVYLVGRIKDMIRRSGENIAAVEVERVLMDHPGVRLAAVAGVPDEMRGEEVKAYIVGDVAENDLRDWCTERLARFKVPRYWEFRAELPMTSSERVAKNLLS
ncbi:AMP-binding protein [Actinoplanes derwentensis]|uniref:Crotonobetaine/carnitine-CoA ligase n=1 Tax=Actinoplanes derwentensis TaxID=113562 RepID=A0A1H1VMS3_9ACTN|nr:AMP-binding protein [Actinoplanes derwentensis]GID83644.1 acyl-CoA synthetase [Actinoplanes derwentensis]SDS86234.1 crotonobetaine/carnitine-CoA ligase [Actinoplanes derwentensis]